MFLGYHQRDGGKWSADYYVADWEALRLNPDAGPRQVRAHRVREVVPTNRLGDLTFPLAHYRLRMRTVDIGPEGVDDMFAPDDPPVEESGAVILLKTGDVGLPYGGLDPAVDDIRGKGLYDERW